MRDLIREFETIVIPDDEEDTSKTEETASAPQETTRTDDFPGPSSAGSSANEVPTAVLDSKELDSPRTPTNPTSSSFEGSSVEETPSRTPPTSADSTGTPHALPLTRYHTRVTPHTPDVLYTPPTSADSTGTSREDPAAETAPLLLDDVPCLHPITGELMNDFDWLGAISDFHDGILRPGTVPARREESVVVEVTESLLPEATVECGEAGRAVVTSEPGTTDNTTARRKNPPRAAKEGVSYTEQLENAVPLPEYCKLAVRCTLLLVSTSPHLSRLYSSHIYTSIRF